MGEFLIGMLVGAWAYEIWLDHKKNQKRVD